MHPLPTCAQQVRPRDRAPPRPCFITRRTVRGGSGARVPVSAAGYRPRVSLPRILVLVLAGGAGGRLELLTDDPAKPAVPFAGVYRLIDFPLSNCQHSQIADVWVSVQFHPTSLSDHLANGRPWDLDRTFGGLMMLPPFQGTDRGGWHTGTADSLWRNAELVRDFDARRARRRQLRRGLQARLPRGRRRPPRLRRGGDDGDHRGRRRRRLPLRDRRRSATDDAVTDYAYKPDEPATTTATNEVFVFTPGADARPAGGARRRRPARTGLEDLGNQLLPDQTAGRPGPRAPAATATGATSARCPRTGRRTATSSTPEPPIDLDDPAWPVHTRGGRHSAARVLAGAEVDGSLLSGGTRVAGTVRGSVLSPGVVVEKGATVVDSVLLPGVRVRVGRDGHPFGARRRRRGGRGGRRGRRRRHRAGRAAGRAWTAGARLAAGARYPEPEERAEVSSTR